MKVSLVNYYVSSLVEAEGILKSVSQQWATGMVLGLALIILFVLSHVQLMKSQSYWYSWTGEEIRTERLKLLVSQHPPSNGVSQTSFWTSAPVNMTLWLTLAWFIEPILQVSHEEHSTYGHWDPVDFWFHLRMFLDIMTLILCWQGWLFLSAIPYCSHLHWSLITYHLNN